MSADKRKSKFRKTVLPLMGSDKQDCPAGGKCTYFQTQAMSDHSKE